MREREEKKRWKGEATGSAFRIPLLASQLLVGATHGRSQKPKRKLTVDEAAVGCRQAGWKSL